MLYTSPNSLLTGYIRLQYFCYFPIWFFATLYGSFSSLPSAYKMQVISKFSLMSWQLKSMQRYKKIGKMLVKKKIWMGGGGREIVSTRHAPKVFCKRQQNRRHKNVNLRFVELQAKLATVAASKIGR